ncbi:MAG: methionine--tRNA ligase [Rickettsiales bacterium]|jgi:methionyl-tRNA synthetase|nr:methionine--tRNA ligase [Rickettsiales bacterium]
MTKKYLITAALPFVNNDLHLGHLCGVYLPADVYARFCRAYGHDVLFICGADEHGAALEIAARKENMTFEAYSEKYRAIQETGFRNFNMSFDLYGQTHTPEHEKLIQSLFTRLDEQGLIEEKTSIQPYSVTDKMFLADRFIEGTCPHCGYARARGDQCDDGCGALLEPQELINPRSVISGATDIEMRETKHLYLRLSKMQDKVQEWVNSRTDWSKTAVSIANKWLKEGLQDRAITRDLKWGIPVNKPGYDEKVFYVWFDNVWGYVSISQVATKKWADWWKAGDNCYYAQFMGKDNIVFHSIMFPSMELAVNDNWKMVDLLKGNNFLNFEGAKISKSTGNGIFMNQATQDAPADAWRYALLSSAPETDDTDFTVQRFADIVNKDLNGMLGNFVSRVCKLAEKNFGAMVPPKYEMLDTKHYSDLDVTLNSHLADLTDALERCEFRKAVAALREIWAAGNEFMTRTEPWALIKNGDMDAAAVLNECFQLIDFYARVSAPFIPGAAEKIQSIFGNIHDLSWPAQYERRISDKESFTVPENIFNRIDDAKIMEMTEKYTKKSPKIVIAKILTVEPHPESDRLNVLSVDAGDGKPLQIVCGCPNVRPGLVGVLAKIGAQLPGSDAPIAARKMRGVVSYGMMCGPDEIGLSDKYDEHLAEMPEDSVIGAEFKLK